MPSHHLVATLGHVGCFDARPAETFELDVLGLWKIEHERIFTSHFCCASGWVIVEAFGYWWRLWQLERSLSNVCMRNSSSFKAVGGDGHSRSQMSREKTRMSEAAAQQSGYLDSRRHVGEVRHDEDQKTCAKCFYLLFVFHFFNFLKF